MNAKFLNPSNYFSVADFEDGATFKIVGIDFEEVEEQNNKTKKKGAIRLDGVGKPWLCNVTNVKCLVAMFGDETEAWINKRVTLCHERVMAFGEQTLGVRLRGSPDIANPVSVRLKLRKKREQVLTMQPTGAKSPQPSPPKPDKPKTPYDEMWKDFKAAGLSDPNEFRALVKEAFNGKTKDFTNDDVLAFSHVLASRQAAPPAEPEAPPPF